MAVAPGTPTFLSTVRAPATSFVAAGLAPGTTYQFAIRAATPAGTSPASTPLASATTLTDGLEGDWMLDEVAGTVALDSSGLDRTGTLSGGAAFTSSSMPNIVDDFSAVLVPAEGGATISIANAPAFSLTGPAFSVALWVNVPDAASSVHIIGQRAPGCGAIGWELVQLPGGLAFASGDALVNFGSTLTTGAWAHVAVTYDGTRLHALINGVETASKVFAVAAHGALPLELGHVGGCAGGSVLVDDVQIWSRELTAAEVATLASLPPSPRNLVATTVTSTRQRLTWTPVPGAEWYFVFRGTAPGNEVFLTSTAAASTTFESGTLAANTQYTWQVAAVKGSLFSARSNEVAAKTLAGPAAPMNVAATALSTDRVRVTWATVAGAVMYQVLQAVGSGPRGIVGTTTATSFTAAGLAPATLYSYSVRAVDSGNTASALSVATSATTP
jgi:hypothetical protein